MTDTEFSALFGTDAHPLRTTALETVFGDATFTRAVGRLQKALRCTTAEALQAKAWMNPFTKTACLLAIHATQFEDHVSSCLGNIVRADLRRLEDLQNELDDEGADVMLLGQVVVALSSSVV